MYVRSFIMNKWKIKDSISVDFLQMSELSTMNLVRFSTVKVNSVDVGEIKFSSLKNA